MQSRLSRACVLDQSVRIMSLHYMCSQCHTAAVLKGLMKWIKSLRNRVCCLRMSIGVMLFRLLSDLNLFIHCGGMYTLTLLFLYHLITNLTYYADSLRMKWHRRLILVRMVLDLHERDFGHKSHPRSHTLMLYKARLSCYVLLTLLQLAAVLTVGHFPDIMEMLLFYKINLLVQSLYSEYMCLI